MSQHHPQHPVTSLALRLSALTRTLRSADAADAARAVAEAAVAEMDGVLRADVTIGDDVYASAGDAAGDPAVVLDLTGERGRLGELRLYAGPAGLTDEDAAVGELLASMAAAAVSRTRVEDQLRTAVASRDVIGQAKGILMQRYGIDADHAFALLTRVSSATNTKLRAVAEHVAAHGELPGTPA